MPASKTQHNRRKRRRAKAKPGAVRPHKRQAGRTGQIKSKQTPSKKPSGIVTHLFRGSNFAIYTITLTLDEKMEVEASDGTKKLVHKDAFFRTHDHSKDCPCGKGYR